MTTDPNTAPASDLEYTDPNTIPATDLEYDIRYAGLVEAGQWIQHEGRWRRVTGVRFPPEHASVVAFTLEGRRSEVRTHADNAIRVVG